MQGQQICDFFAFRRDNPREYLSPAHTRIALRRLVLRPGDKLLSVFRLPMFEIVEDTSPGIHDMIVPSCDRQRYLLGFGIYDHDNCRDNLHRCVSDLKIPYEYLPDPINFFQCTPVDGEGNIGRGSAQTKPGDKIVLRALMDMIVVGSACPHDIHPTNGPGPSDLQFVVRRGA